MNRVIASDKSQKIMFAEHYLDDRLPDDHEVYVFDELLNDHDLSEITESYNSEGGKVYSPRNMIGILLYSYSKGITSSYKIAAEIRTNLVFIYLAGGNIMSRRAICQFRRRNAESLKKLFSSTIQNAVSVGLVDPDGVFAIDGSKFSADASKSKTKTKADWEERQEKITQSVNDFFDTMEKNDLAEEGLEEEHKRNYEEVMRKIRELKANANKSKAEIREANKIERQVIESKKISAMLEVNKDLKPDEKINLTEPESRMMQNGTGEYVQGFNAQIITSNQIICAADLVQDENDQVQLQPMIIALEKEIPANSKFIILADAGYNKGKNLKWLDGKKNMVGELCRTIDAYISMNDRKEDAKTDLEKATGRYAFEYDEDEDRYDCPTGKLLEFHHTHEVDGELHNLYRADLNDCQRCPARHHCLTTQDDLRTGAKNIDDDGTLVYRKEMKDKMDLQASKSIYADRAVEPEPVWGHIKHNLGFRRLRLKGFAAKKGEFLLMATAVNLSKLLRFRQRSLKEAMA